MENETKQPDMKTVDGCNALVMEAREVFQNKSSTDEHWQGTFTMLLHLRFHCPQDQISLVDATIAEMQRRSELMGQYLGHNPLLGF